MRTIGWVSDVEVKKAPEQATPAPVSSIDEEPKKKPVKKPAMKKSK